MRECSLWNAYESTLFRAERTPVGPINIRIGASDRNLDRLLDLHRATTWCFIAAWNPRSKPCSTEENRRLSGELQAVLRDSGFRVCFEGVGIPRDEDWKPEESLLVIGADREDAWRLGRRFDQNAVVWGSRGAPAELIDCRVEDDRPLAGPDGRRSTK